jgi:transposase InsO family protein
MVHGRSSGCHIGVSSAPDGDCQATTFSRLLHHFDRGSTSTSECYQALLREQGMKISMSRTADCYDNAAMESFFHSLRM